MDATTLELYLTPEFIVDVERNIDRNPHDIALDKNLKRAPHVATRVKYLQRSRTKLPSYYDARCVIWQRAYEQSSGEGSAHARGFTGGSCLDLTCGLGVDSLALSKGFRTVVALERDPVLAATARHNFKLLATTNIEVVCSPAEEYLSANYGQRYDLIYVDPDRRDTSGNRRSALGDCSPDVESLLPLLRQMSDRVVVKLSPLFDIHEVFRIFGPETRCVAVSEGGECKEVLVETGPGVEGPVAVARMIGRGTVEYPYLSPSQISPPHRPFDIASYRYLASPDVALVKSGTARRLFASKGWTMPSQGGFAFGNEVPEEVFGRIFSVLSVEKYSPKKIRSRLKSEGITRVNITTRDFPAKAPQVAAGLGVKEGGGHWLALTTHAAVQYCLWIDPL